MAIDDFVGEPVLTGTYLYDGTILLEISIMARNYDENHAAALDEVEHVREAHGYEIEPPGSPRSMGPDGVLYHIASSPDFDTIAEAKVWADAQAWGPVTWNTASL